MDEILAKLTSLTYEIFGIFLPGIITSVYLLLLWIALDDFIVLLSLCTIPSFSISQFETTLNSLTLASSVSIFIPLIALWYFFGHLVHWIARGGKACEEAYNKNLLRITLCLTFRIPRSDKNYNEKLEPMYQAILKKFKEGDNELEWAQFFPVAKIYLQENLTNSLVPLYQNKYTLHRSITCASAMLFWLSFMFILIGLGTMFTPASVSLPNFAMLLLLLITSIILVWGFSSSFMFNWLMFGNTIITETYSLLFGPKLKKENEN